MRGVGNVELRAVDLEPKAGNGGLGAVVVPAVFGRSAKRSWIEGGARIRPTCLPARGGLRGAGAKAVLYEDSPFEGGGCKLSAV